MPPTRNEALKPERKHRSVFHQIGADPWIHSYPYTEKKGEDATRGKRILIRGHAQCEKARGLKTFIGIK